MPDVTAAAGPVVTSTVEMSWNGEPFGQMVLAGPGQVVLAGSAGGGGPALRAE